MKTKEQVSRRDFFKSAGVLAGAAAWVGAGAHTVEAAEKPSGLPLRRLGKTDLMIPPISLGTGPGQDVNVMKYAITQGLNFIHTSVNYKNGVAADHVAEAIKGQRNKVILGLKITWKPDDDAAMDAALETLGVESVDIAFFNIHKAEQVKDPAYKRAAERWKKAGKFRYIGLTTHKEVVACMNNALNQGFYDALMPAYSYSMEDRDAFPALFERAEKEGLGIVLMKTRKNINDDLYFDAVPHYLATAGITTINKGLTSFQDIQRMLEAAAQPADPDKGFRIRDSISIASTGHCSMCGLCEQACPLGLPVADVVRCSDYYMEHPDYVETAFETYRELAQAPSAAICLDCTLCEQACRNGVPIVHHIRRAESVLA